MTDLTAFARALLEARQTGKPMAVPAPSDGPQSAEEAYAVQDLVIAALGEVGGWKIAPPKDGAGPRAGVIPASAFLPVGAAAAAAIVGRELEVEIGVEMAADLPGREQPYGIDDIRAAIGAIRPCFEVLESRYGDRTAVSFHQSTADMQSNFAVVVGPASTDWNRPEPFDGMVTLSEGGIVTHNASGKPSLHVVLEAITWLANHAAAHKLPLRRGQVIITGSRLGPLHPTGNWPLVAKYQGLPVLELSQNGV
jgi:2-keto-4-pentenoate hydratase